MITELRRAYFQLSHKTRRTVVIVEICEVIFWLGVGVVIGAVL